MYNYDPINKVGNTVHEPYCLRGGNVTASSVTGTGPGAVCPEKPEIIEEPKPIVKNPCKIRYATSQTALKYYSQYKVSLKTC